MKKFIIVIVFLFLIAILVSFNYLIWDREKQLASYQDMSDSNNLTIDALSDKMNNLDKLNKELNTKNQNLTNDNKALSDSISTLEEENGDLNKEIISKNALLIAYRKTIDIAPINAVIKKWVEDVNSGSYIKAQAIISDKSKNTSINDPINFEEVFKSEIKSLKLKSSKLYTEMTDDEHLDKIQFEVVFEVNKQDNTNKDKVAEKLFKSGLNKKYLTMDLNAETNQWTILDITDNP